MYNIQAIMSTYIGKCKRGGGGGMKTVGAKKMYKQIFKSTENDHMHHHKFIKYEKRLRKEGQNMFGLPIKQHLCHFSASLDA